MKELVDGKQIEWISEIKLLIFGDFKKHTFKYQFLSTAIPLENVIIKTVESVSTALPNQL